MATIGQTLAAPEAGWKRYDDNTPYFKRSSGWTYFTGASYNGGGAWYTTAANQTWRFDFIGTKLRVLYVLGTNRSAAIQISVDGGAAQTFSEYNAATVYNGLVYEITGLTNTRHSVVITTTEAGKEVGVDSLDIDSTGRLLHPDEVTDLKDLAVGKRIRCHYAAASGVFGSFTGIGSETSNFLPAASSVTPNGDFYIIHAANDYLNRKILIADRNVQLSISWNNLNTAGIASGSGLPYVSTGTYTANLANAPANAFADSSYTGRTADLAFDGLNAGGSYDLGWEHGSSALPAWLGYDFQAGNEKCIRKYTIQFPSGPIGLPDASAKDWQLQVSNDNSTWTTIHTVTNAPDWVESEKRTYTFSDPSPTKYRYYRIYFTRMTATQYLYISEVEMMEEVSFVGSQYKATIRLPTGGISAADKDNEWDQYIVKSTLNGSITPGDDNVWHWNTVYSWPSTSYSSVSRTVRGYSAADYYYPNGLNSNYVNTTVGFRPVLVIESMPSIKYLFQDGMDIKKYGGSDGWSTVGPAPVTQAMFDTDGMTNLSVIDNAAIQSLVSAQPKLLMWTDASNPAATATVTAVPKEHLIMPTGDISMPGHLATLVLTASEQETTTTTIIPVMTSNTAPGGVASASSIWGVSYDAFMAFEPGQDVGSSWYSGAVPTAGSPQWIAYDFGTTKKIRKFVIWPTDTVNINASPKDFSFEGWNGSAWITIQSYTGISGWVYGDKKEFIIDNPQGFTKYRVKITANNGSNSYTSVGYLEMMEAIVYGKIRVIASPDSGTSWKTWDASQWADITADAASVRINGMSPARVNGITEAQWSQLITNEKLRFAYYLDQTTSIDVVNADAIILTPVDSATVTPTLDSVKVTFDELTVEGRMQDLEKINAINIARLNFKSNVLLISSKYALYQMIIDTFETSDGIDAVKTTAAYDTINKEFTGSGKDVVTAIDDLPTYRKSLIIVPDGTLDLSFQYTLDGSTWNNVTPNIVVDISSKTGNQLQVKATLPAAGSKLTGIGYSWA